MNATASGPLTVTGAQLDGSTVGLRCENGTIAAVGTDVGPQPGDEVIDAAGAPLVPALVNAHTHAAMTLFRGSGGDLPLMRWLRERIWPVEGRLDPEDVYWGTRLACVEMTRTGTARFWDTYWHPEATARAVQDSGLRAAIGAPLIDADRPQAELRRAALESLVYAAAGSIVDTTVVAGRVLMRGGEVPGSVEVVARARERAKRLGIT